MYEACYGTACAEVRSSEAPPVARDIGLGFASAEGRLARVYVRHDGDDLPGYGDACALADRLTVELTCRSGAALRLIPWAGAGGIASGEGGFEARGAEGAVLLYATPDWLERAPVAPALVGSTGMLEIGLPSAPPSGGGLSGVAGALEGRVIVEGLSVEGELSLGGEAMRFTALRWGRSHWGSRARFRCMLEDAEGAVWNLRVAGAGVVMVPGGVHPVEWVVCGDQVGLLAGTLRAGTGVVRSFGAQATRTVSQALAVGGELSAEGVSDSATLEVGREMIEGEVLVESFGEPAGDLSERSEVVGQLYGMGAEARGWGGDATVMLRRPTWNVQHGEKV